MVGLIPNTLFLVVITSTLIAGLRRGSGLTFQTTQIQNATGAKVASIYLAVGEWAYERLVGFARGSKYFKYDPNVTVDGVKDQVNEFTQGIKAAADHLTKSD
ncbi:hypothetical protein KVR01_013177 [Diaporthe batatas]|uniref:uncharacterized protein n=1 Tax=Diaporthe batatas TaxID=748121 RepID=UPI001D04396E|nr:uncharacterized protein KVR01_013177 [Diaporthe batatas]KAG8156955.1 hypothetical protein KVR01_013177 [Diaporthe batatas]